MKKIFFAIITCALLIPVSAKHVYFYETFGNVLNSSNLSADDCKDGDILYYSLFSPFATNGSSDTTIVFGYFPGGGLSAKPDYVNPCIRIASSWQKINTNIENWVSFNWLYTASENPDPSISIGIAVRTNATDSSWIVIASEKGGAGIKFITGSTATNPEIMTGKIPEDIISGCDSVQIAVFFNYSKKTSSQWMLYMDNISFVSFDDLRGEPSAALSINAPNVMTDNVSNYNILSSISNESNVAIDSIVLAYTLNGGEVKYRRQRLSPACQILNSVDFPFNPEGLDNNNIGENNFEVWIDKLNDKSFTKGELGIVNFSIYIPDPADAQYPTKFLVEHFTSSTCGPCTGNNAEMTPYYEQQDAAGKLIYIKYQMNWPGNGDPYYVAQDGGVRKDYYGVSGVPTMIGNAKVFENRSQLSQKLTFFNGTKSFLNVSLDSAHIISQKSTSQKNIYLEYTITPKLTAEATIHTVVFENVTYKNKRSNGETEFHHVVMKMFPDGNGNVFQFKKDSAHKFVYTHNMNNTNIEEIQDLQMVVFVQNDKTGEIYVAAQRKISFGIDTTSQVDSVASNVSSQSNELQELQIKGPSNPTSFAVNSNSPVSIIMEKVASNTKATKAKEDYCIGLEKSITATEKVVNTLSIKTYPNPATDELTVESPANSTLLLYNNAGILVYEGANKVEGKKTISLVSMPSGIYTLKVVADKGVATQKIIKK